MKLTNILEINNLEKRFAKTVILKKDDSVVVAVNNVSFSIQKGEVFVLAGESGSGKSTIAKIILKTLSQDSGEIIFNGEKIDDSDDKIKKIRMNCQMIQQDPYDSINPRMKIRDIISEPLHIHKYGSQEEINNRITEVLHEVKLDNSVGILEKFPHMLSGGQRQRIVLARALSIKPRLIIADEPVSMLDVSIRAEILKLMENLQKKYEISFLYITHDLATARFFGQKIGILYKGKIVEMGKIEQVLLTPKHPYTQALIDAISEPDPKNLIAEKQIRITNNSDMQSFNGCNFATKCPYFFEKCQNEPKLERINHEHYCACFLD
jgi:peptide/nickel transport system ATP-binding protein